jgi:MYXO-CTERM domain-containing protein
MAIPTSAPDLGSPTPMAPADVLAAYAIPPTSSANGKIVAILDLPDTYALGDLNGYRALFPSIASLSRCAGLPTGSGPACFAEVSLTGGPSSGTDSGESADSQTAVDMDMISAVCPDCSILHIELPADFTDASLVQGAATAASLGASAVVIGWGSHEASDPNLPTSDGGPQGSDSGSVDVPGPYSTPGHLVFSPTGGSGYDTEESSITSTRGGAAPQYPASSPYVVAVGGTALYASAVTPATFGEGVYSEGVFGFSDNGDVTTSGCSTEFGALPWQAAALVGTGCSARAVADISIAADFSRGGDEAGITVYVQGEQSTVFGTWVSAPLAAGIFTRLGLTTEASNDLGWMYAHQEAFNDVGNAGTYPLPSGAPYTNAPAGSSCGKLCNVGDGWDGPSGIGSPNGAALAALPLSDAGPEPYPDAAAGDPWDGGAGIDAGPPYGVDAGTSGASSSGSSSGSSSSDDGGSSSSGATSSSSGSGVASSGGTTTSTEDGGNGNGAAGGSGGGGGGCDVVATNGDASPLGLLGAMLGLVALGVRRRRARGALARRPFDDAR